MSGHQECAGNLVPDARRIEDIKKSVEIVKNMIENMVPVVGVFIERNNTGWEAREV